MRKRYLEGYYYKYELPRFIFKKIRKIVSKDTTAGSAALRTRALRNAVASHITSVFGYLNNSIVEFHISIRSFLG
jgi:hypothetical protein